MRQVDGSDAMARVRDMRRNPTLAEKQLWASLRASQIGGFKFRRQMWIGGAIVDFVCMQARLVIELDGGQHDQQADDDARRSATIERGGYRVLRFWNNDVIENLAGVLARIAIVLDERVPSPSHRCAAGPSLSLQERAK